MMLAEEYLEIPRDYGNWLGGLRWSLDGDAIEFTSEGTHGFTYVLGVEVAPFLEGLTSQGGFHHFGHVLHMLDVLGYGLRRGRAESKTPIPSVASNLEALMNEYTPVSHEATSLTLPTRRPAEFFRLAKTFLECGSPLPLRNAGAFCGTLCSALPKLPDPPALESVVFRLLHRSQLRHARRGRVSGLEPPLSPDEFEARMAESLAKFSNDELRHWFKHGRGSVKDAGRKIARALPPTTVAEVLSAVVARPRLKGARGLVARLSGALSLPPRKLAAAELPVGGYTDVATRGRPEQILPFQFALDTDEFLRRFAERELLYFHREEPKTPSSRALLLVLDQGVRTWGDIRLVLVSASLALAAQADRKGLQVRFAATSHVGSPLDPALVRAEGLGELLDASDLTADPAASLAVVLGEISDEPRDVVLLTHPRNLAEPAVVEITRAAHEGTRLFAVTVGSDGSVELSILRQGRPVVIGRCRVDFNERPEDEKTPLVSGSTTAAIDSWRGDVESVPFPFRVGPTDSIADHLFAFDDSGEWLLAADHFGVLRLRRTNGTGGELLPRGESPKSGLLNHNVESVVGVAGGFVVIGFYGLKRLAVHYDIKERKCVTYEMALVSSKPQTWTYLRRFHTVIGHNGREVISALDLGTETPGVVFPFKVPLPSRTREMLLEWDRKPVLLREINGATSVPILTASESIDLSKASPEDLARDDDLKTVRLDLEGRLHIREASDGWRTFTPLSDGQPRLKNRMLIRARWQGQILAILVAHLDGRRELLAISVWGECRVIGEFWPDRGATDFAMSRDGRRIAWRSNSREILVRDLEHSGPPTLVVNKGRAHSALQIDLGEGFLTVQAGRHAHLLRWNTGRLFAYHAEGSIESLVGRHNLGLGFPTTQRATAWPGTVKAYWRARFFAAAEKSGVRAAVDRLGQVSMFGSTNDVVCMFFFFRHQIGAWAPDGTRMGPLPLIGGPETPDAAERIGRLLKEATELSSYIRTRNDS